MRPVLILICAALAALVLVLLVLRSEGDVAAASARSAAASAPESAEGVRPASAGADVEPPADAVAPGADEGSARSALPAAATPPRAALSGTVVDATTGEGIAGAEVVLAFPPLAGPLHATPEPRETRTDADGRYAFRGLEPGLVELVCRAEGFGSRSVRYVEVRAEGAEHDLRLEPGASLAGRVVDAAGEGIAGAVVTASTAVRGGSCEGTAVSDADGRFAVRDLVPDEYAVEVEAHGFLLEVVAEVPTGEEDLVVSLRRAGAIVGRVTEEASGAPLADFDVVVRAASSTDPAYGARVATAAFTGREDGSFEIAGLERGAYVVQVGARGFARTFSEAVRLESEGRADAGVLALGAGATVVGRVTDGHTRAPLAGAEVELRDNHSVGGEVGELLLAISDSGLSRAKARTDADGRFELALVTPGDYQVRVRHPSFLEHVRNDVRAVGGETTDLERVAMRSGGTVAGTVRRPDGGPAAGVEVFLVVPESVPFEPRVARTDGAGRFRFDLCPPAAYRLSLTAPADPEDPLEGAELVYVSEGDAHERELRLASE